MPLMADVAKTWGKGKLQQTWTWITWPLLPKARTTMEAETTRRSAFGEVIVVVGLEVSVCGDVISCVVVVVGGGFIDGAAVVVGVIVVNCKLFRLIQCMYQSCQKYS